MGEAEVTALKPDGYWRTRYGEINQLANRVHQWAINKGWWEDGKSKTFPEQAMLMVTELAEAVEEYRAGRNYTEVYYKDGKPEGIPIELADCIIRIFDTASQYGIDLELAMETKMKYNETRPMRHGGKKL